MDNKRSNLSARSLLVPARGFKTPGEAKEYLIPISCHQLADSSPAQIQGEWNRRHYVTMPGYWFDTSTDILQVKVRTVQEDVNTLWVEMYGQSEPDPGYPICLLAGGSLKYHFRMGTNDLPAWVKRLMNGQRDCYAVWQQADGTPFRRVAMANPQDGLIEVHAARSGRGAVYARTAILDHKGQLVGYSVVHVRLEFAIMGGDDILRVKIGRTATREEVGDSPHVNGLDMDEQWKQLMAQAQQGFFTSGCQCLPDEVESDRLSIVDQVAKFKADAALEQSPQFRDLVKTLSWQDSLKMVSELWQLEVVRRVHLQSVIQPPCRTLLDMIQQHDCQEERREELRRMALALVDLRDCF